MTSRAKCRHLIGSLWKLKRVIAVIRQFATAPIWSDKLTLLTCDWVAGGVTKTRNAKIISVTMATSSSNTFGTLQSEGFSSRRFPLATLSVANRNNTNNQESALSERATATPATHEPALITHHGTHWITCDIGILLNGAVRRRARSVLHVTGERVAEGHGLSGMTPWDKFQ